MTLPVALLFPGQGAQHQGMATGLYGYEPVFTAAFDEVLELFGDDAAAVRADWLSDRPVLPVDHVRRAQPLLFAVEYALGRLVAGWGVRPSAFLGHSAGELVAAVFGGVFSLPDAVRVQRDRIERLAAAPAGGMVAVAAGPVAVEPYLEPEVVVGAVNGPRQILLAGPEAPLVRVTARLREAGLVCRRAGALHGYHSPSIAPMAARSTPVCAAVTRRRPAVPVYSCYTGRLLAAEATDPSYWARQPAAPVLFESALGSLLADGPFRLVEAGPGQGLTTLARGRREVRSGGSAVVGLLPARPGGPDEDRGCVRAAAALLSG